jgi:hypothetical protein
VAFPRAAILALVMVVSGCVTSQSTKCGDVICPIGHTCASGHCVTQSVVRACQGLTDAASCDLPQVGTGSCQAGLCVVGQCGDGKINAIEACDRRNLGGKTCLDFGSQYAEGLRCTADCSFDKSGCAGYCGDGRRQPPEECDGTDFAGKTCITEGFYTGALVCQSDCTINRGSCAERCGDNIRNSFTEQCDGTDFSGSTCAKRGYFGTVSQLQCTAQCAIDSLSCMCGDDRCAQDTQRCVQLNGIFVCEARPQ